MFEYVQLGLDDVKIQELVRSANMSNIVEDTRMHSFRGCLVLNVVPARNANGSYDKLRHVE